MSTINYKIEKMLILVNQKITNISGLLDQLENKQESLYVLEDIQPLIDLISECGSKYILPNLCEGEFPAFPVQNIDPNPPKEFPEISGIPLPSKALPPIFPDEDSEDSFTGIISSVVIEGCYFEPADLPLLPMAYQNITTSGHQCNRAKFEIKINNIPVGIITLNNVGGSEDLENTPSPLTGGTWTGSAFSRYTRIDITEEQAENIVTAINSTILQVKLVAISTDPHTDITWLRISKRVGEDLIVIQDVLAALNQNYAVNVGG